MSSHIVSSFDAELQKLSTLIADMGAIVGAQIEHASDAFRSRDAALARKIVLDDQLVDALQLRIEERVITLIAKRQPLAVDLRDTIATLKIATDLERMGDLAKNNAKRVIAMSNQSSPAGIGVGLETLSERVHTQLQNVMHAYAKRDKDLARDVWLGDSEIDTLHTALFRELLTYMMEDPRSIGYCTHLLFCAKNLERVGDHATNIAENIYYVATGEFPSGDRPKGESSSATLMGRSG
ncbi:MAG: phosphate signaling complex protein PhoU [Hyphomicrobiaceae bacterium]|nr:phosphate signaling complex protein PhoU [Hyphomicrobiaceae bacterium]